MKLHRLLGSGSNGIIYEVSIGNKKFAAKFYYNKNNKEHLIIQNLNHSGLIKFFKSIKSGYLMDLADYNMLNLSYIKISEIKIIAKAILYCHSNGIIHGDIKPENILVKNGKLKLADFGCAQKKSEFHCRYNGKRIIQTIPYVAPEVLYCLCYKYNNHLYPELVDMWSFGVILYDIISSKPLFSKKKCKIKKTAPSHIFWDNKESIYASKLLNLRIDFTNLGIYEPILRGLLSLNPHLRWNSKQTVFWFESNISVNL